jgi:hypothetical protein
MKPDPDISRREFIKKSAFGGASLLTSGAALEIAHAQGHQDPPEASAAAKGGSNSAPAILENDLIRIEIDSINGNIIGLRNKRSGHEYITAKGWAKAFRLNVPLPGRVTGFNADYSANSFDSWSQTNCTIARARENGGQSISVQYSTMQSEAGRFPIKVTCIIRLDIGSDEARFQLELENSSQHLVREVFFFWFSGIWEVES